MTHSPADLQQLAHDHLWGHFSRLTPGDDGGDPDHRAGRGLLRVGPPTASATSTAWPGCSPCRSATAARSWPRPPARQAERARPTSRSGPTPTRPPSSWPPASPTLAPGDLNRVFFTTGGGEAVESAWKLARQYFRPSASPAATR